MDCPDHFLRGDELLHFGNDELQSDEDCKSDGSNSFDSSVIEVSQPPPKVMITAEKTSKKAPISMHVFKSKFRTPVVSLKQPMVRAVKIHHSHKPSLNAKSSVSTAKPPVVANAHPVERHNHYMNMGPTIPSAPPTVSRVQNPYAKLAPRTSAPTPSAPPTVILVPNPYVKPASLASAASAAPALQHNMQAPPVTNDELPVVSASDFEGFQKAKGSPGATVYSFIFDLAKNHLIKMKWFSLKDGRDHYAIDLEFSDAKAANRLRLVDRKHVDRARANLHGIHHFAGPQLKSMAKFATGMNWKCFEDVGKLQNLARAVAAELYAHLFLPAVTQGFVRLHAGETGGCYPGCNVQASRIYTLFYNASTTDKAAQACAKFNYIPRRKSKKN